MPQTPTTINLFTHASSYFHSQTRNATEEITTGSMWDSLLNKTHHNNKTNNLADASLILQKEMQQEAWPKGLDSFKQLDTKKRAEVFAKSPFVDPTDGLIKVGGRLSRADLSFGRKHPTLIPDTLTGDALLGYLHSK